MAVWSRCIPLSPFPFLSFWLVDCQIHLHVDLNLINLNFRDAIVTWIKKKIGPGIYNITTTEDAEHVLTSENKVVLGFLESLVVCTAYSSMLVIISSYWLLVLAVIHWHNFLFWIFFLFWSVNDRKWTFYYSQFFVLDIVVAIQRITFYPLPILSASFIGKSLSLFFFWMVFCNSTNFFNYFVWILTWNLTFISFYCYICALL